MVSRRARIVVPHLHSLDVFFFLLSTPGRPPIVIARCRRAARRPARCLTSFAQPHGSPMITASSAM